MLFIIIGVIFTFLFNLCEAISGDPDILEVSRRQFPSYVEIGDDCGGVLLDSTSVLTSSECFKGNYQQILVRILNENGKEEVIRSGVSKFIHNEKENQAEYHQTRIGIIKLKTPIYEKTNFIKYAKLPSKTLAMKTSVCTAVGFGTDVRELETEEDNEFPKEFLHVLHKLRVKLFPIEKCLLRNLHLTDNNLFLCGITSPTCMGISKWFRFNGGPLYCMVDNEQIVYGIGMIYRRQHVINVSDELFNWNTVFTQTLFYHDWIKEKIGNNKN